MLQRLRQGPHGRRPLRDEESFVLWRWRRTGGANDGSASILGKTKINEKRALGGGAPEIIYLQTLTVSEKCKCRKMNLADAEIFCVVLGHRWDRWAEGVRMEGIYNLYTGSKQLNYSWTKKKMNWYAMIRAPCVEWRAVVVWRRPAPVAARKRGTNYYWAPFPYRGLAVYPSFLPGTVETTVVCCRNRCLDRRISRRTAARREVRAPLAWHRTNNSNSNSWVDRRFVRPFRCASRPTIRWRIWRRREIGGAHTRELQPGRAAPTPRARGGDGGGGYDALFIPTFWLPKVEAVQ